MSVKRLKRKQTFSYKCGLKVLKLIEVAPNRVDTPMHSRRAGPSLSKPPRHNTGLLTVHCAVTANFEAWKDITTNLGLFDCTTMGIVYL